MTDKAQALIDELVSACIAFGRGQLPDWQTRIETAQRELREYVEGLENGSNDSPDVCEACGGDGSIILTEGYKGQVIATVPCPYCNGIGKVLPEVQE